MILVERNKLYYICNINIIQTSIFKGSAIALQNCERIMVILLEKTYYRDWLWIDKKKIYIYFG